MKKTILVIFKKSLSEKEKKHLGCLGHYDVVISYTELHKDVTPLGYEWVNLEDFTEAGSIYKASGLAEELSQLTFPDGTRISKSFTYKGYELWWIHYNKLFLYGCLPFTQYQKLLSFLKDFQHISFYHLPYKSLFSCYLEAYGCGITMIRETEVRSPAFLPFGTLLQAFMTFIFLPILMMKRNPVMIFTSDLFEKSQDYDFRMKFIYQELRQRDIHFTEIVRSLESWRTVLNHAFIRRRPVIYSEGVALLGRFMSAITGGQYVAKKKFGIHIFDHISNPEERFKLLLTTQSLLTVYDDVWSIRIIKRLLNILKTKVAYVTVAADRNYCSVIGCKLEAIPIVGILHGVASRHYNVYDFLPAYDGEKSLSVDKYGVWSEWWKEYYLENSKAYQKEQLYVSGPMRPLVQSRPTNEQRQKQGGQIKVLFVSEQLAVPEEVLPYLESLLSEENFSVYIVFRPYADGFESWLKQYHPEILERIGEDHIFRNGIKEGIPVCDVVVGSHSTAVLEALLELKPMIFFATGKWGDYFNLKGYNSQIIFYAGNTKEFINSIKMSMEIPTDILKELQERFFGNPYQNGSKWVVEQLIMGLYTLPNVH